MNPSAALWAVDIGDAIGVLIVILFVVIPAVAQLVAKMRKPQPPGRAGRPAANPAGRPAPRGVEDEIGEFLRRAAGRRGGQAPARRPPPPPPVPVEAEVVLERPPGDQVKEHVGEYLNTGSFARRAAHLGERVSGTEKQTAQHLQQAFGHDVSQLAGKPGEASQAPAVEEASDAEDRLTELPSTAAAGLAAMLSNAESIRQAIIINEILPRPEHRWT
jgi:hypothetical protein